VLFIEHCSVPLLVGARLKPILGKRDSGAMVSPQLHRGEAMIKRDIPNENTACCRKASPHASAPRSETKRRIDTMPPNAVHHKTWLTLL